VSLLTLRVYQGETLLRTETFTQAVIKVGKLVSSHLRLDDDRVSRMHAVIEVADTGEVSIIDLGSHQGTTVNGVKISKTAGRLRDGDVLRLGDTRLVLGVAP
jgi:pSer/pThr/pTyr-binding forkhead associated (FHA) protein